MPKFNGHMPSVSLLRNKINSSVGVCGVNLPYDVGMIQKLILDAGYQLATGRMVKVTGKCDYITIEAIHWYQRLLLMSPTGLISPVDISFMEALQRMSSPLRPVNTSGILSVPQGQFTFDQEGSEYAFAIPPLRQKGGRFLFSRMLHWPEKGSSGVTIGRGYDMGKRTRNDIYMTLRRIGIEEYKAELCSRAAGMKGHDAQLFVKTYRPIVGEITHQQQVDLFNISFTDYVSTAERIYNHVDSAKLSWSNVDPKVKDVFYDTLYQGNSEARKLAEIISQGDKSKLIAWLNSTRDGFKDERRDKARIAYLQ
ncbi:peptidoglycan-binding protein [Salmonella enterica subsp. enterica]|nr:peptidoglycan-binding protein [Salmonella enterica subsp. enterica]